MHLPWRLQRGDRGWLGGNECSLSILLRSLLIIQGVDDPVWGFSMPLASPPFYRLPFGHITDQIRMSLRG